MPIKNATPEEIRALKNRLNARKAEAQMDQAVKMASRSNRRPLPAPANPRIPGAVETAVTLLIGSLGLVMRNLTGSAFGMICFAAYLWMAADRIGKEVR